MDEPKIISTIIANTFTTADLNRRLSYIREFGQEIVYHPDDKISLTDFLESKLAAISDIATFTILGDNALSGFDKDNIYGIINNLEADLKNLPVITVYLPYPPETDEIVRLGKWFRTAMNNDVLMDLKVNKELLAGCAFVWKGIYHEFTLHFFMKKSREALLKIFESYV